jgi:hypothetical protein
LKLATAPARFLRHRGQISDFSRWHALGEQRKDGASHLFGVNVRIAMRAFAAPLNERLASFERPFIWTCASPHVKARPAEASGGRQGKLASESPDGGEEEDDGRPEAPKLDDPASNLERSGRAVL